MSMPSDHELMRVAGSVMCLHRARVCADDVRRYVLARREAVRTLEAHIGKEVITVNELPIQSPAGRVFEASVIAMTKEQYLAQLRRVWAAAVLQGVDWTAVADQAHAEMLEEPTE